MNLYEFEGKQFFAKHGIEAPKGFQVRRGEDFKKKYQESGLSEVVVKAQVLSGKRGKNNAIKFCASADEVESAVKDLFNIEMRGQYVAAVRIEEKLDIVEEHYLSITYDTNARQPILVYSAAGGADIEGVPEEKIEKVMLDIRDTTVNAIKEGKLVISNWKLGIEAKIVQQLWECFLQEDCRLVEINPLVKTKDGRWVAADAKVAIDDDAIFRHEEWKELAPRTMMGRPPTEREIEAQKIDAVEKYYQGTAGKYIEM
ncbi:MAG: ATP-grasp domain-containing protein, partial [Patescibacteria group bacterium]